MIHKAVDVLADNDSRKKKAKFEVWVGKKKTLMFIWIDIGDAYVNKSIILKLMFNTLL